ncbi:NAD-dependent epimerase/dehydratase family protein [Faecalibacter bovis]|uniref:UDP-glucose 4-epimerase n=1 Tax=Faecalibacter bovis TaxID=2898187 RepID=A0ABX7X9K8_9FLAO|nr:NAD-dependent epimerase/dehydratase family protein [Faecalibacter bovis]QTV04563.1 NAD-dependent epimerase/dehydratase family protein [Faecalibacter bovis]
MIIGRGLIAKQFLDVDREDVIFFASGVSNSSETKKEEFLREQNLIEETIRKNKNKLIIYFSTCSIYDSSKYNSPYVLHKLHMEEIIKESSSKFLILRISNAVGKGGNPNLLMNYIYRQIVNNSELVIHKNATRNLIDVVDVKNITLKYLENNEFNKIVNVAYTENYYIQEIIEAFEDKLNIKSFNKIEDRGEHYSIDVSELDYQFSYIDKIKYLNNLIKKYYK